MKIRLMIIKICAFFLSLILSVLAVYACITYPLVGLLFLHWILSLFPHSFFHHRYASHTQFKMARGWEKFWFIASYILQGPSYLVAVAYAVMHRLHHKYADTVKDPHSPSYSKNLFDMMWRTKLIYSALASYLLTKDEKEKDKQAAILHQLNIDEIDIMKAQLQPIPRWDSFDRMANSTVSKVIWGGIYIGLYVFVAIPWAGASYWWTPLVLLHFVMAPNQGVIINWFAHTIGEKRFVVKNTSRNFIYFPIDIIMWGERYHNTHHRYSKKPNFAYKTFGIDPAFIVIWIFNRLGIVRFNKG